MKPCGYCKQGQRPFAVCVVLPCDSGPLECAECQWNNQGKQCSFRPAARIELNTSRRSRFFSPNVINFAKERAAYKGQVAQLQFQMDVIKASLTVMTGSLQMVKARSQQIEQTMREHRRIQLLAEEFNKPFKSLFKRLFKRLFKKGLRVA